MLDFLLMPAWVQDSQMVQVTGMCHPQLNIFFPTMVATSFPGGASHKESACQCRRCKRQEFSPGVRKIPLEMATHSSILALRIPWTEEPGGLQFTGLQIIGHD